MRRGASSIGSVRRSRRSAVTAATGTTTMTMTMTVTMTMSVALDKHDMHHAGPFLDNSVDVVAVRGRPVRDGEASGGDFECAFVVVFGTIAG
jgi:hypothetical protein